MDERISVILNNHLANLPFEWVSVHREIFENVVAEKHFVDALVTFCCRYNLCLITYMFCYLSPIFISTMYSCTVYSADYEAVIVIMLTSCNLMLLFTFEQSFVQQKWFILFCF